MWQDRWVRLSPERATGDGLGCVGEPAHAEMPALVISPKGSHMSRTPIWKQPQLWTAVMGLAALAFWIVGLGAGLRGWILEDDDLGIVAHAQAFGVEASAWWTPATVLTMTTVMMALGTAIIRHLAREDGPPAEKEVRRGAEPATDEESGDET